MKFTASIAMILTTADLLNKGFGYEQQDLFSPEYAYIWTILGIGWLLITIWFIFCFEVVEK